MSWVNGSVKELQQVELMRLEFEILFGEGYENGSIGKEVSLTGNVKS